MSKCSTCGRWIGKGNYRKRWLPGTSTNPQGVFECSLGHKTVLNLGFDFFGPYNG